MSSCEKDSYPFQWWLWVTALSIARGLTSPLGTPSLGGAILLRIICSKTFAVLTEKKNHFDIRWLRACVSLRALWRLCFIVLILKKKFGKIFLKWWWGTPADHMLQAPAFSFQTGLWLLSLGSGVGGNSPCWRPFLPVSHSVRATERFNSTEGSLELVSDLLVLALFIP